MSPGDALLIFIDRQADIGDWLRLSGGQVVARGHGPDELPALVNGDTGDTLRVAAVVAGDEVALHWLELPDGLAPAQAAAAGRLLAVERSAQPLAEMHVAVGPDSVEETARAVALVPAARMASWIGLLQARGLDPDLVLPEPLLLPAPDHGFLLYDDGELPLLRSRDDAFSIEPELVEIVVGDQQVERLDRSEFEAGLAAAIADPPVNLRQGAFAKRRRWKIEWPLLRRLAGLAVGILVATLLIQVVYILRYTYAADALEAEADRVASAALRRPNTTNASAQLGRRVAELGGSGARYAELAPAIFAAVRDTPMVELSGLQLDRSGSARVTVQADSPASLEAFQTRLRSSGLGTVPGPLRTAGGRPTAEIMVSAQ